MQIRKKTEDAGLQLTLEILDFFILVFKTALILEADIKNTIDTSDSHDSLVHGGHTTEDPHIVG